MYLKSLIAVFMAGFCFLPGPDDPETPAELGERLFSDPTLSSDRSVSCASCHRKEFAFADTARLSAGVGGRLGARNTPAIMNMSARPYFFYDGRAATLEEQVFHPIRNPLEMDMPVAAAVARVRADERYRRWFHGIYRQEPDSANIGSALAAFIRTLESPGNAAFDLWMNDADTAKLMTPAAIRGRRLFMNKGRCFECHFSPDFTGDAFHNIGLYDGETDRDPGRFAVTRDSNDLGRMKVPGLRNVAITAPYMHDGRFRTLREVIDYYDNPKQFVPRAIGTDPLVQTPLALTEGEKNDLIAFLHALTDAGFRR